MFSPQTKFDVNSDLMNGRAALHYAADYGQVKVVEYLCSLNADVNVSIFYFSLSLQK